MQETYIKEAFKYAKLAKELNEIPVGAVIVDNNTGKIIAKGHNLVEKLQNPIAHAEINVINEACAVLNNKFLYECSIYVTLEPCPMCAQAISNARIKRLYFSAYDTKSGGVDHGARIFNASSCHHKPEIYGGINEHEASQLMKDFFSGKRD